jgi:acylphosphatase
MTGSVRNCSNGDVEVVATGSREQHSSLRQKLQQGPRASRVDTVSESKERLQEASSFRIEGAW